MRSSGTKLFSPIDLGSLTLKNRVVLPGHTTNFGYANKPTRRHATYLAERAKGGVGLIVTEAIRVHPTSAGRHISLGSFSDESIDAYSKVVSAVHQEGAAVFAQLMHAGRQANGEATRTAAWAPSPVAWSTGAYPPHAMGVTDIAVIVDAFGQAARRMSAAGFDGIELHLGHGHLLQQFLSPVTNQRADNYGGSLNNRMRIVREVLRSMVDTAPEMPIAFRVSADEFLPGGLEPEHVVEIVNLASEEVKPVYVNVSHSAYHASYSLATQIADMAFAHKQFVGHAKYFKEGCPDIPVLAVCRLDSLSEAAILIDSGEADLVGLVRPHIADPYLVVKALAGKEETTRSCLACNQACIQRVEQNLPISCVVNPEVGFEAEWSEARKMIAIRAVERRSKVLVIGGGPAGMSAALSADQAGSEVTLIDAGDELGGQVLRASQVPGRERLGLLVRDVKRQLENSGVRIVLGEKLEPDEVKISDWHHIIVATGAIPSQRFTDVGITTLDIWSAADFAAGKFELPDGVIILVDDEGTLTGSHLAEAIGKLGREVHIVSSSAGLASRVTTYSRLGLVKRFADLGVQVHLLCKVENSARGKVELVSPYSRASFTIHNVAALIDAGSARAEGSLYHLLDAGQDGTRLHIVGDANSPRTAFEAVFEGQFAGTFLGSIDSLPAKKISSVV